MIIVSHNVFWFQGVPYGGAHPTGVHEGVLMQLIDLYRSLSVDLLCLQEVHQHDVAERIGRCLKMRCHYTPGCRQRVYGGAVFWRPEADAQVRDFRDDETLTPFRSWQRITWRVGDRIIRVTHLHLPSARSTPGQSIKPVQQDELNRFAVECDFSSDVILGDFNAYPDAPHVQALRRRDLHDVAAICGQGGQPTTATAGSRIDQIWLSDAMCRDRLEYRVIDLAAPDYQPKDERKTRLSDHQPLFLSLMEPAHGKV